MMGELEDSDVKKDNRRDVLGWALVLFLMCPLLLVMFLRNPEDERRLSVLRQMAAETPPFPGSAQVGSTEMAKSTNALLLLTYKMPADAASFGEVRVPALTGQIFFSRENTP